VSESKRVNERPLGSAHCPTPATQKQLSHACHTKAAEPKAHQRDARAYCHGHCDEDCGPCRLEATPQSAAQTHVRHGMRKHVGSAKHETSKCPATADLPLDWIVTWCQVIAPLQARGSGTSQVREVFPVRMSGESLMMIPHHGSILRHCKFAVGGGGGHGGSGPCVMLVPD
jgi:hypothetical protein